MKKATRLGKRQKGTSTISIIAIIGIFAIFVVTFFKLFPMYYGNFKVKSVLEKIQQDSEIDPKSKRAIWESLRKRLYVDEVRVVRREHVTMVRKDGKTTVTALVGHLLRGAGIDCEVAGNIGPAALAALLARTRAGTMPDLWVLELSSYQLETTWSLEPDIATLLNLSEDHLDRYAGLDEYANAKARVFQGQGVQVLNRDDRRSAALAAAGRRHLSFGLDAPAGPADFGLRARAGETWLTQGGTDLLPQSALRIHGRHNVANALAAAALAHVMTASPSSSPANSTAFSGIDMIDSPSSQVAFSGALWRY